MAQNPMLFLFKKLWLFAGSNRKYVVLFILLDESTSSVDPKNEWIIYENILKHFENKTIIASIHKKHLLPLFDRVLEFKEGRLHEN